MLDSHGNSMFVVHLIYTHVLSPKSIKKNAFPEVTTTHYMCEHIMQKTCYCFSSSIGEKHVFIGSSCVCIYVVKK